MKKQAGFTLVEILLASALFGFVLIFITFGFVLINRTYTKGITVKRVHETTRAVIEDFSRSITTTGVGIGDPANLIKINPSPFPLPGPAVTNGSQENICIGSQVRYQWTTGFNQPTRLLKDTNFTDCADPFDGDELIDDRLAVQEITIRPVNDTASIAYSICVVISTDTDDLASSTSGSTDTYCRTTSECSVGSGDQYCDTAKLSTVVTLRSQ